MLTKPGTSVLMFVVLTNG